MPYDNIISRTDAAAAIPEEVSEAMMTSLANESVVLDAFTRVPVNRAQTRFPVLSALPVAYFVTGDTGLKQTTEIAWANRYLDVEELAAIVPIPENVLDDVDVDVWGQVRPLLENAVARAIDAAAFFATNKPAAWPSGIVAAAIAAGNVYTRGTNAAAAGGIIGDFSELYALVEADGYDPDTLIANRTYRGRLRQARTTQGDGLDDDFARSIKSDAMYPMRGLWPSGASAAEAVVLQRDQFVAGIRQDFTYKVLTEAVIQDNTGAIIYNFAQQDMVGLRVTFRVGWQVANTINYDQSVEASRYPAGVLRAP